MLKLRVAAFFLALLIGFPVHAQTAHQVYEEWLTAFNSGEKNAIQAFYRDRMDDPEAAFAIDTAKATCGFDPVRVEARAERAMTILLAERCFPALQRLHIELGPVGQTQLAKLKLKPLALTIEAANNAIAGFADRLAEHDEFEGSLLIAQNGTPLLERNWGSYGDNEDLSITLDTPMYLASAGKMFTAVSILQLVDAGSIDLDAPLGTYLTDYPNSAMAEVTIRQLLQHRGGTGETGILARHEDDNRTRVRSIDDVIALNGDRAPSFVPGTQAEYSNFGYILLGAVIERVSGQSYYEYIADHVFAPADMVSAGYPSRDDRPNVATGLTTYYGEEDALTSNVEVLPWRGMPDGGGVASANDMLKFFNALQAGQLLSPAMFELATSAGETSWYGIGFVTGSIPYTSWGHGGISYGMDVAIHHYPSVNSSFICLATRDMACNRLIWSWVPKVHGSTE